MQALIRAFALPVRPIPSSSIQAWTITFVPPVHPILRSIHAGQDNGFHVARAPDSQRIHCKHVSEIVLQSMLNVANAKLGMSISWDNGQMRQTAGLSV